MSQWRSRSMLLLLFQWPLSTASGWAQGVITTFAGADFVFPRQPLPALSAPFGHLTSIALGSSGALYICDGYTNLVLQVSSGGVLSIAAGNGVVGFSGDGGQAISASLNTPSGCAVDSGGNLFISDFQNGRIRKVAPDGTITTIAGNGVSGYSGDGGPALLAEVAPYRLGLDAAGSLYITSADDSRVRRITADGIISTVAGNGKTGYSGDGGPAVAASLSIPSAVVVDPLGNLYIADAGNNRVRKVSTSGIITTIAGNGSPGSSGDAGLATAATLNEPNGLAMDAAGNLYIANFCGNQVRVVTQQGTISTVAGSEFGANGYSGDGGPATAALLEQPSALALDSAGNLFIAEYGNERVRKVTADGTITTVAGNGGFQFSGDFGSATAASLSIPEAVAVDSTGNVFIAIAQIIEFVK